jgi:hypothetical protein
MGAERSCRLGRTAQLAFVANSMGRHFDEAVTEFNRASTRSTLYRSRHLARAI